MKLLLDSSISSEYAGFFIEIGLDIYNNFEPVVQLADANGVMSSKFFKLRISEWFEFLKLNLFNDEQSKISGHSNTHTRTSQCTADATTQTNASLGEDAPRSMNCTNSSPPSVQNIGCYSLVISNDKVLVYQIDLLTSSRCVQITFYQCLWEEIQRLKDTISLKLEFLHKYRIYTLYLYSRFVNYYLQNDEANSKPISKLTLDELPPLSHVKMVYSDLDPCVCKVIQGELRIYGGDKIYKDVENIKSTYYPSWFTSGYMYV